MFKKKHYKKELHLDDMSQMAFIIAGIETIYKLGWKLTHLSQYGMIAHTTKKENAIIQEVVVRRQSNNLLVRSDNTRRNIFSKNNNEQNITNFLSTFDAVKQYVTDEYALQILQTYQLPFAHTQNDILSPKAFARIGKRDSLLDFLKPVEGYFVTPILLLTNMLVFALMVIMGADFFEPTSKVLYEWGANFGKAVSGGEWWRLLSAMFLHIGIIHLLSNMMALGFIGFALEPILGKTRFLTAYIITGIAGSLFSIYNHPDIISAGASGAIFGMYGVLIAVLTTKLGEGKVNAVALPIMSLYILYQLAMGMKDGVDNASHIGGLISGIVIGYAMYPGLKAAKQAIMNKVTREQNLNLHSL
ncbi:MAG: rhomboid family intramembrane serine protease [Sphingobacteriales bacterium]|nr:MAG: rhomboid family intramembrane serine protease [Sphingobacteriales bacterium]